VVFPDVERSESIRDEEARLREKQENEGTGTLFNRLHKQVVIEIQVITNLRSNSWGTESYYLYYWDIVHRPCLYMFSTLLVDL